MYITGRVRKLMQLLLQADQAMTVKHLAHTLEVSERTVHRDLKDMEDVLPRHHLELIKQTGIGMQINGSTANKQALEVKLSGVTATDFTPEERQTIIFATLLEAMEPTKLYSLATELQVTIATVSHDLDQLEQAVTAFNLQLIRKQGYGVTIEGSEANKRSALSHLISRYIDPSSFVPLLKKNIRQKGNQESNIISRRLLGLVNPATVQMIENRVEKAREELPYELADSAYVGLVVHLALAIERLKKGETIQFDPAYLSRLEGTDEYHIANRITQDLADSLEMDIPNDEIGYITMHLLGAKLRVNKHQDFDDTDLDITFQIKALIQYIENKLGVDLTNNVSLLNDLIAHLRPTIYRLQQGMNIHNPLVDDIKEHYDDLFQLVREAVGHVFASWTFPDDEIGYLVLHFGAALMHDENETSLRVLVICSSGIGTAKILATNLTKQFPEMKQVDNVSLFDLYDTDVDAYDLVVSTIALEDFKHPYVLASPILRESEIHQIKKQIREITTAPKKQVEETKAMEHQGTTRSGTDFLERLESIKLYTTAILNVMHTFQVKQIDGEQSMESALSRICKDLTTQNIIRDKNSLHQRLLEREKIGGLGIPSTSMILFHTRSKDVMQPNFTIHSLDQPISVNGMDGQTMEVSTLLLMLVPETAPQETLEIFSYVSSLLIKGQRYAAVFQSGDEDQIRNFLLEQLEKFIEAKKLI